MKTEDLTNENLSEENSSTEHFMEFSHELDFEVEPKEEKQNIKSKLQDQAVVEFDLPKNQSSTIKVIGVGGGGSNAVNYMFEQGIKGVDFVICNTDAQALNNSLIPTQIQLGIKLTEGLGAGENPEVGENSALESINEINSILKQGTKMVFITAGMGGGTGTGAAPIIAQKAKELDILTIAIVTVPFSFEGKKRMQQAQLGIDKMKQHVDSLIVINNDRLIEIYGKLGFKTGFAKSDEVLTVAAKGISEVITVKAQVNIDLNDAKTVLKNSGTAIMGSAKASGENRAMNAIKEALDSPLLNLNTIRGADKVLLLLMSGNDEITFDEIGEINTHIQKEAGGDVDIIMGVGEDEDLENNISVTIIATGSFGSNIDPISHKPNIIIHELNSEENNDIEKEVFSNSDKKTDLSNFEDNKISLDVTTLDTTKEIKQSSSMIVEESEVIDTSLNDEILVINEENEVLETSINIEEEPIINKVGEILNTPLNVEEPIINVVTDFSESPLDTDEPVLNNETNDDVIADSLTNDNENNDLIEKKSQFSSNLNENDDTYNLIQEQKRIAEERSSRLDRYNYDLELKKETRHIQHIEDEPAYKRQGVELDNIESSDSEDPISRLTLNENEQELKSNNSFLHDNVD